MGVILLLFLSACFWAGLYFTLCMVNSRRSYEWNIRIVATLHALSAIFLGLYSIFVVGPWPLDEMGGPSTLFQEYAMIFSLGYFVVDMTWCLYFNTEGPEMLLHHFLCIVGISATLLLESYGTELLTTLFGTEITNPLLQARWFLKETNNYNSIYGDIIDWAFMITFGLFRIVLGSILLFYHYTMPTTDYLASFGGTCIYLMGWIFWIQILKFAQYKLAKNRLNKRLNSKQEDKHRVNGNTGTVESNGHCAKTENGINGHTEDRN